MRVGIGFYRVLLIKLISELVYFEKYVVKKWVLIYVFLLLSLGRKLVCKILVFYYLLFFLFRNEKVKVEM